MIRIMILITAILGTFMSYSAVAQTFEFKDLKIGEMTTAESVETALAYSTGKLGVKCMPGSDSMTVCNGISTIAEVYAQYNVVLDKDSRLVRILITVEANSFDLIAEQMIAKYGKKGLKQNSEILQNRFGAQFTQVDLNWKNGTDNFIHCTKYSGGTIENSSIYFSALGDPMRPKPFKPSIDL